MYLDLKNFIIKLFIYLLYIYIKKNYFKIRSLSNKLN